jgi:ribosomal protein S18 acetylase RimI-like enzyme
MIEIRPVHPEEYEEAGRVTASAWEPWDDPSFERFSAYLRDVASRVEVAPVFVAVDDDAILGSVTLEMHGRLPEFGQEREPLPPEEAHVRSLGVAPLARRRGVARALMVQCIEYSRSNGKSFLTLNTGEENIPAQQLYESLGFRRGPDLVVRTGFGVRSYQLDL